MGKKSRRANRRSRKQKKEKKDAILDIFGKLNFPQIPGFEYKPSDAVLEKILNTLGEEQINAASALSPEEMLDATRQGRQELEQKVNGLAKMVGHTPVKPEIGSKLFPKLIHWTEPIKGFRQGDRVRFLQNCNHSQRGDYGTILGPILPASDEQKQNPIYQGIPCKKWYHEKVNLVVDKMKEIHTAAHPNIICLAEEWKLVKDLPYEPCPHTAYFGTEKTEMTKMMCDSVDMSLSAKDKRSYYECFGCKKSFMRKSKDKPIMRCAACLSVSYCSPECQTKHWEASHKNECKQMKREKEAREALEKEKEALVSG